MLPDLEADHDVSSAVLPMAFTRFYQFPFPHPPPSPAPTQTPYPVFKDKGAETEDWAESPQLLPLPQLQERDSSKG